jgi:DNA-binding transcriptional MocR family regulator
MKLPPFLLDEWLERFKGPGIRYDLASSTGPAYSLRAILELADEDHRQSAFESPLVYCPAAGGDELRAGIAELHGVSKDDVLVTTGAEEALHILFFDAAEPGANVVVSAPGFPPTWTLPESLGLEVRRYHLRPENGFRIDLEEVDRLVDARTRLLLVTSPSSRRRGERCSCPTRSITRSTTRSRGALRPRCRKRSWWATSRRPFASRACASAT